MRCFISVKRGWMLNRLAVLVNKITKKDTNIELWIGL